MTILDRAPSRICLPRWATSRNPDRPTYGHEARQIARVLGFDLMPWQQDVFDIALEHDGNGPNHEGSLVYREVVLTLPRQSGKSLLLLTAILHRLTVMSGRLTNVLIDLRRPDLIQRAYYTAQTGQAARAKFLEEWWPMIERSYLSSFITEKRRGMGGEILGLGDKGWQGTLQPLSATTTAGHGKVTDWGGIDEAWTDVDDRREQALVPGMNTRPSPQLWLVSTAGTEDSVYLRRKVDQGRLHVERKLDHTAAYFEWSAPDEVDVDDEDVWYSCMPALDLVTPIDAIRSARMSMLEDEFRRAYLNQWVRSDERIIPYDRYLRCLSEHAAPNGALTFGIDANPNRTRSALAVSDGRTIEVIRVYEDGLDRMIDDTMNVVGKGGHVAVDKISPAASKIPILERAGLRVTTLGYPEVKAACGEMFDAVVNLNVSIVPNKALTLAVEGSRKKMSGDLFSWDRRTPDVDITPLNAVTFARAAATNRQRGASWGPF